MRFGFGVTSLALSLLLAAPSAGAQTLGPRLVDSPEWTVGDGVVAVTLGLVGTGLGAGLGGASALALSPGCLEGSGGCMQHLAMGASLGCSVLTALGVWTYGELAGHDGDFGWTLVGSSAGTALAVLVVVAADPFSGVDDDTGMLWTLLPFAPAVGATIAYATSRRGPQSRRSGYALLDLHGGRLSVQVPALAASPEAAGGLRVTVPLLGGSL